MSQSSFEIKTAKDLYLKLVREHERITADLWASDHAINFSITAHHLYRDWLRRELSDSDYSKLKDLIESKLPIEIGIIRDVCDGTKHLYLSKPPHMQVSDSGMKQGAFSKLEYTKNVNFRFDILQRIAIGWTLTAKCKTMNVK